MYSYLPYVPDRILQCATSGYTVLIGFSPDGYVPEYDHWGQQLSDGEETGVSVYDTKLAHSGGFSVDLVDEGDRDIVSAAVALEGDPRWPDTILMSVHLRDQPSWECLTRPEEPFIPSTTPFRVFVVKLDTKDQFIDSPTLRFDFDTKEFRLRWGTDDPLWGRDEGRSRPPHTIVSIAYRVPTELNEFINLPKVRKYCRKMIVSIWVLSYRLPILDVVSTIIMTSVRAYQEFDYTEYCEHQINKY